jgi:hypothetical protein
VFGTIFEQEYNLLLQATGHSGFARQRLLAASWLDNTNLVTER